MQCFRQSFLLSRTYSAIRTLQSSVSRSFCEERNIREQCLNEVTLLGRVGSIPTIRSTEKGTVATFSMATNNYYNNEQQASWHRVAVFKPFLIDLVSKYVTKGNRVLVKGKIVYGEYEDNNGIKRYSTSIAADNVLFVNSSRGDSEAAETESKADTVKSV